MPTVIRGSGHASRAAGAAPGDRPADHIDSPLQCGFRPTLRELAMRPIIRGTAERQR